MCSQTGADCHNDKDERLLTICRDVEHIKRKNHSHVDIWVYPPCFLRHHGISRIHRVAKSMSLSVEHTRWLAKINFDENEQYQVPELMQVGRSMVRNVPGIRCTWIHPRIESRYDLRLFTFLWVVLKTKHNRKYPIDGDFL